METMHKGSKPLTDEQRELVEKHMGLVTYIVSRMAVSEDRRKDIWQFGAVGLCIAAQKFEPSKGFAFSTYAAHWIRAYAGIEYHSKGKQVRAPAWIRYVAWQVYKIDREDMARTGTTRSDSEVAKRVKLSRHVSEEHVKQARRYNEFFFISRVRDSEGHEDCVFDLVPSNSDTEGEASSREQIRIVLKSVDGMRPKYRRSFEEKYFGDQTLDEVGKKMGLTRERIRQMNDASIRSIQCEMG